MKTIYHLILALPLLISANVFGQLTIEKVNPFEPSPVLGGTHQYKIGNLVDGVLTGFQLSNWQVVGGTIVDYDGVLNVVAIEWNTQGEGSITYTGNLRFESNSGPPNYETVESNITSTVEKKILVRVFNVATYFDTKVVYTNCSEAILKSRGDIPLNEEWYWQLSSTATLKDKKVVNTLVSETTIFNDAVYKTDDTMLVTQSQDYYIRAFYIDSNTWSEAKSVTVDFSTLPTTTPIYWYLDRDNDGFGDPSSTPIFNCVRPIGYANNKLDECPTMYGTNRGCTYGDKVDWYTDVDNDGYGDPNSTVINSETQPAGLYVSNNLDNCPTIAGDNRGCATTDYQAPNLTQTENYQYTLAPQVAIKNLTDIEKQADVVESVVYYDDLGRNSKSIAIGQSPKGNDIVSVSAYDVMGRQSKQYLPYASSVNGGAYHNVHGNDSFIDTDLNKFYTDYLTENNENTDYIVPYSETLYDTSGEVLKQSAPGKRTSKINSY